MLQQSAHLAKKHGNAEPTPQNDFHLKLKSNEFPDFPFELEQTAAQTDDHQFREQPCSLL